MGGKKGGRDFILPKETREKVYKVWKEEQLPYSWLGKRFGVSGEVIRNVIKDVEKQLEIEGNLV